MNSSSIDKFWDKVELKQTGLITQCWNWIAYKDKLGYGQIRVSGKLYPAHRFSYNIHIGQIPRGLDLDHLCRNPSCVNPQHLEAVSRKENVRRGLAGMNNHNFKKTNCLKGHPYSGDNLYTNPRGDRCCKTCNRENSKNSYWRKQLND